MFDFKVSRENNSKWFISKDEFEPDIYGKYCSGSAFLLTNDLPPLMYNSSLHIKFFWVDDYYISGMLATSVNATYFKLNQIYIVSDNIVEKTFKPSWDYTVFFHIQNQTNTMHKFWKHILANQLRKMPSLAGNNASFLNQSDFLFIKNFAWTTHLWLPYLKDENVEIDYT